MMKGLQIFSAAILATTSAIVPSAYAIDVSLNVGVEGRHFFEDAAYSQQTSNQLSTFIKPEFVWDDADNSQRVSFVPYYRYDAADDERSHGDIRELMWMHWQGPWEIRAGIGKVFWGVTESLHLVDVINQTDSVDAADGDEKLGQPMVHGIWLSDSGTFEAFVLPGFRERTFAGEEGRLRAPYVVNDDAIYQANAEQRHTDLALRWSRSIELMEYPLDLSVSLFRGTSRDPAYLPDIELIGATPVVTALTPYYAIQNQAAATVQYSLEGWLLKTELLRREYHDSTLEDYSAAVSGFEYTLVGPFDSSMDLGLLLEYQYDERDASLTTSQNDIFAGMRFAFNDAASSEVLAGVTQDLDNAGSWSFFLEASTRLRSNMTIDVNAFLLGADTQDDLLYTLRRDDFVEVALNFYY